MPNIASTTYPDKFIKNLYSSGLDTGLTFIKKNKPEELDENFFIIQQVLNKIEKNNLDKNEFDSDDGLIELFKYLCFLRAWSDSKETLNSKKDIKITIRRFIHVGLFINISKVLLKFQQLEKKEEKTEIKQLLEKLQQYNGKKEDLINVIQEFLKHKKFTPDSENNTEKIKKIINESYLASAKAISEFSLWNDKLFYGSGFAIGLIASLACGLSTGAAIFILLASLSLPLGFTIPLSILIFIAGTRANFQLFSQHIPQFFHDLYLCKKGGITEYIDQQGKPIQLSRAKKFLLLPLGFFSLSVGITAAAITYLEGTKMIALICPALAVTCPHLTVVLLGVLAAALLVGLTIVMLRTFIGVLHSKFSWQDFKRDIQEKRQNITATQIFAYLFKILVMAAAFFGLVYLDFTGTTTLAGLLGWVAADAITIAAILGDLPFTLKTALAWCNSLFKETNSNLTKDTRYYLGQIVEFLALIINAVGNAALVFTDSCVSRMASVACFMNSYASNRIQEGDNELIEAKKSATEKSISSLHSFFKLVRSAQIPDASNEAKEQPLNASNEAEENRSIRSI